MKVFVWNLILAFFWMCLWGELTFSGLISGYFAGFIVIFLTRALIGEDQYFKKFVLALKFFLFFMKEFIFSALKVAYDIVTPRHHMRPGILRIPLELESDAQIQLFSSVVTLTPGTLSLDIAEDRKSIFVHFMYVDYENLEEFRLQLRDKFENKIKELFE